MHKSSKINMSLEGLRGICALTVALSHIQGKQILVKEINPLLSYINFGHIAVLIFFVLSGYVIGINYPEKGYDKKTYLSKRFLRIYPIYIIVVLFCFLIEPNLSFEKIFSQIFVLQNWFPQLSSNVVLWSIHYEILFYLLFLITPHELNKVFFVIISFMFLSFLFYNINSLPQTIGGYFIGASFWLSGFIIAKFNKKVVEDSEMAKIRKPIISLLLLAILFNHLASGQILLNGIGLKNDQASILSIADITSLPLCVLIILEIGNIKSNKIIINTLYAICFVLPLIVLSYILVIGRLFENIRWIICSAVYLLSIFTFFLKINLDSIKKWSFWGSISYALYIIHFPIGFFIGRMFSNTTVNWILPVFIWIVLTVFISWLLEKKFQPMIKTAFIKKHDKNFKSASS